MKTTLRLYQTEAVEAFLETGKGTLVAHPGAGKTIMACAIIERLRGLPSEGGQGLPSGSGRGPFLVLVITPTLELVDQWHRILKEQETDHDVLVITYARAARMLDREKWWDAFSMLVLDEAHHVATGAVFQRLLIPAFKAPYALSLTSTPPEDPSNLLLRVLPVLYRRSFADGVEEGFAAPLDILEVPIDLTIEERIRYEELTDKIREEFARIGDIPIQKALLRSPGLRQAVQSRKALLTLAEGKFKALGHLVQDIIHRDDPSRIFVWSELVEALYRGKDTLKQMGISSAVVHGKMSKTERRQRFEEWGTTFRVLFAAKLGEEGIDVPAVAHGLIIAGARTRRQNVQRVGRLLRPMFKKRAKLYILFATSTTEDKLVKIVQGIEK